MSEHLKKFEELSNKLEQVKIQKAKAEQQLEQATKDKEENLTKLKELNLASIDDAKKEIEKLEKEIKEDTEKFEKLLG